MEENNTPIPEESGPDQANVFDGWDAVDSLTADQPEGEETAEATADQTEVREPAPEQSAEEAKEEPAREEGFLTLKHLDEVRTVTREEARTLAQKGLDYDRIRTERDELRSFREENSAAIELVRKYAGRSGMGVAEYLEFCRTQELMSEQGITAEAAKAQVSLEKREMEVSRREEEQTAREQAQAEAKAQMDGTQERIRREVAQFLSDYPEVTPGEVPGEVFELVQREGVSLSVAYGKWKLAQQGKELEALRAQESARRKSPGSLSDTLQIPKTDPAFDGWD